MLDDRPTRKTPRGAVPPYWPPAAADRRAHGLPTGDRVTQDATRRAPTLDEVARLAGVSRSVASRAINGAPHVRPAKRDAVAQAVASLGYAPNPNARGLATHRVGSVVLAVPDDDPALFADPFFAAVARGASRGLEETDLLLTLVVAPDVDRLRRLVHPRRTDGILLMGVRDADPLLDVALGQEVPVVLGGRPLHADVRWYVDADNRGGARRATELLVRTGHRRIGFLGGPPDLAVSRDRRDGYRDALRALGAGEPVEATGTFSEESGTRATEALLDEHPGLDAVLAANDNMAAGAVRALRGRGLAVPDDVSVVGFDDLPVATMLHPRLTTVHQPIDELGRRMALVLAEVLDGGDPEPVVLPTRLVERESVRARV